MSLYKRGNTWWIGYVIPNGERIRQSAGTGNKGQAKELHDALKAEAWRVSRLGDKPRRTWNEAVVKYLTEKSGLKSIDTLKGHLRWLDTHLRGQYLDQINRELIEKIVDAKRERDDSGRCINAATTNRVAEVIRAVLRKACDDWEWIDRVPKIRFEPEPKLRVAWITNEQAATLLDELPQHLRDLAVFSLATGLRRSNVTQLTWSQVDLLKRRAWIYADQAKGKEAIPVPLNDDATSVVAKQIGKHPEYVFTYQGHPVKQTNTKAWRKALKRAGITNFRWHDLRHTWASWHRQQGTPLDKLKALGGWKSFEMVERYAHLSAEHLAPHANALPRLIKPVSSTEVTSQFRHSGEK
jgi:integrase